MSLDLLGSTNYPTSLPRPARIAFASALLGAVTSLAWPARAQPTEPPFRISGGINFGITFGDRLTFSLGADFRTGFMTSSCGSLPFGGGPFLQGALLINSGGPSGRFAIGAHAGADFGVIQPEGEIGYTYRGAYAETPTQPRSPASHGLHLGLLAAFLYYGDFSVRGAIPLRAPPGATPEMTIALGGRYTGGFGGVTFCGTGRPLQVDGRVLLPPVLRGAACEAGFGTCDGAAPDALAAEWLEASRAECASIPVFVALARDLALLGAPDALVASAAFAADEELAHTVLCAAVAARLSGVPAVPELLDAPAPTDRSPEAMLVRLAVEAWRDGCVGEGAGAAQARAALAAGVDDPLARSALARIEVGEGRHADLAWDVLGFCLARGGAPVARAVEAVTRASGNRWPIA